MRMPLRKPLKAGGKKLAGLLLALAAAYICSRCFFQLALIQGSSMEPSYHPMQLVLVDKQPRSYSRGDVVVFRKDGIHGVLVKRIAAGPGDRVQISDGILYVNGKAAEGLDRITDPGRAEKEIVLGEDRYFVLGDNVNHSIDSRSDEIGDVSGAQILGRVLPHA